MSDTISARARLKPTCCWSKIVRIVFSNSHFQLMEAIPKFPTTIPAERGRETIISNQLDNP